MGPTGAGGTYDRMKFRSQTSAIWTDGKAEVEGVREQKARRKKIREEKGRRKKIKIKVREKVENVLFYCGGSESRLPKAVGAETGGMSENCTPFLTRSTFWEILGALRCGATQISKSPFWGTPILGNHHVVVDRV